MSEQFAGFERPPDLEGIVHFWRYDGRKGPAYSGYRPAHKLHDNYLSSGVHKYLQQEMVNPGEDARVAVWLITPDVYPRCLWEGREIVICEREKEVGTLRVEKVFNETLRVAPSSYMRVWAAPTVDQFWIESTGPGEPVHTRNLKY